MWKRKDIGELQRLCIDDMKHLIRQVFFGDGDSDGDAGRINASLSITEQQIDDIATSILTNTLQYDIEALAKGDPAARRLPDRERYIWGSYKGLRAITCYRIAHFLLDFEHNGLVPTSSFDNEDSEDGNGVREIIESYLTIKAREISERAAIETTIEINPHANIKRGFVIDHGVGTQVYPDEARLTTVIGESCDIGENVTLLNGVLLGAKVVNQADSGEEGVSTGKRHPTLGDNVIVCGGTRILGGVTIGDGTVIGPCCVVTDDVPAGYVVTVVNQLQYTRRQEHASEMAPSVDSLVVGPADDTVLVYGANLDEVSLSIVTHDDGAEGVVPGVRITPVSYGDNTVLARVTVEDPKRFQGVEVFSLRVERDGFELVLFKPSRLNEIIKKQARVMEGNLDE